MLHRAQKSAQPSYDMNWIGGWTNLKYAMCGGYTPDEWATELTEFIEKHKVLLERPDDPTCQFPPNVHCLCTTA